MAIQVRCLLIFLHLDLRPPLLSGPSVPKVALISCRSVPFLFGTPPNNLEDGLKIPLARDLDTLKAIATSTTS